MEFLKLNSLRSKLILSYSIVGVILVLVILYSIFSWKSINRSASKLAEYNQPMSSNLTLLEEGMESNNMVLFQYMSGAISSPTSMISSGYKKMDSIMVHMDSLLNSEGSIEERNLFRRISEQFGEIKDMHHSIAEKEINVESGSIDLTTYPGYSGDTLIINEEFSAWFQQQNSGSQGEISPAMEEFDRKLVPALIKFNLATERLLTSMDENSREAEEIIQSRFGTFAFFGILSLILLIGIILVAYHIFIHKILKSINSIEDHLSVLSRGDIPEGLSASEDEFSNVNERLATLSENLLNVKRFAQEVGNGNFDHDIDVFGNEGDIGKSLSDVKVRLKNISDEDRKRNWSNQGFAQFGDILRNNADDLDQLSEELITNLVKYLDANQGGIFILDEEYPEDPKMILRGCYAYNRKKKVNKEIRPGQGLVGQCWQEKESIYLVEIPDEYINIRSGLGDSSPSCILIVPLKVNEDVFGVIEIASFSALQDFEKEFVETLSESIASSIATVKTNANTKVLLEESQQLTEEMRAQEEEMRQNMEELQATQEEMQRNSREINEKEANLNALINNTTDSIITINRDYEVLVLNDQVKDRYVGTQYEGIDVGFNVLDMLGDVREEWKGYYDKAFEGERLNFTIKSSVSGEDSFREYFVNPIRDYSGEIMGASVFSRDVTERELEKINSENKSAFLDLVEEITRLTSVSDNHDEIMKTCLEEICNHMDWPIGHTYLPSEDQSQLNSSNLWFMRSDDADEFRTETEKFTFKKGEGLPGRVWETGKAEWITDVTEDPNFPRREVAEKIGLKAGFGFPIEINGQTSAVFEFFSYQDSEPDQELLKLMKHVGTQVGIFLERLQLLQGISTVTQAAPPQKGIADMLKQIKKEEEILKSKMKARGDKMKGK